MSSEIMRQLVEIIETKAQSRPTSTEFELAYQARVAADRIRFAIKNTERFAPRTDQMQESCLQLLDALQRLEAVDRRFQEHCRGGCETKPSSLDHSVEAVANRAESKSTNGIERLSAKATGERARS